MSGFPSQLLLHVGRQFAPEVVARPRRPAIFAAVANKHVVPIGHLQIMRLLALVTWRIERRDPAQKNANEPAAQGAGTRHRF